MKSNLIKIAAIVMIIFSGFSILLIGVGQLLPRDQPEWSKNYTKNMISKTETIVEKQFQAGEISKEEYEKQKQDFEKSKLEIDNPPDEKETKRGVIILNFALSLVELALAISLFKIPRRTWLIAIIFILVQPLGREFITKLIQPDLATIPQAFISMIIPVALSIMIYKGKLELDANKS